MVYYIIVTQRPYCLRKVMLNYKLIYCILFAQQGLVAPRYAAGGAAGGRAACVRCCTPRRRNAL